MSSRPYQYECQLVKLVMLWETAGRTDAATSDYVIHYGEGAGLKISRRP